ncbi:MAG: OmpA family protein [Gemmatimonadota bacterium]|nr:OmpA family protein [Gemmatimonadota bacterium]MDH3422814.1 OmpA family protein [Gemmatimonadota bacterium]
MDHQIENVRDDRKGRLPWRGLGMRTARNVLTLATFFAVASAPASAQEAGTVELGGFFQGTKFDQATTLSDANALGGGGLIGVFLVRNLALEAAAARTWTEDASPSGVDGTHTPLRARLVYAIPLSGWLYPLIGVGGVFGQYDGFFEEDDWAASGLVGFKAYFTDRLALRSDVSADYAWAPFNDGATVGGSAVDSHLNWTLTAGFSIDVGTGRARDTDGDGVRDRMDACANTPLGVRIDSTGCRLDGDRDGVFDENDSCLTSPPGVRVDSEGCRVDTDGDGVYDEDDRCSATPTGVRVDDRGCRVDTDRDGVFDEDDRCTATPIGVRIDNSGCRVDTDADGVFDEEDRCTATPAGTRVDAVGCPVLFEPETTVLVLEGVNFETGSAVLTPGARNVLDRVAQSLIGNPDIRVEVSGHTDSTGSRALNMRLSQQRAEAVAAYLALRGVASSRMAARGYGPDRSLTGNDTASGRAMNRRVELTRID